MFSLKLKRSSGRRPISFWEQDEATSDLLKARSGEFWLPGSLEKVCYD